MPAARPAAATTKQQGLLAWPSQALHSPSTAKRAPAGAAGAGALCDVLLQTGAQQAREDKGNEHACR